MTSGGTVWRDGELFWTDGPDGMNLMFPRSLTADGVQRGVQAAIQNGRDAVGAWLSPDVDTMCLAEAGFEPGWSPWWMVADLADVPVIDDHRVRLECDSTDYAGEHAGYREQLALTRLRPPRAWYAAAHVGQMQRFAGRAWSFRVGDLAGIFDMAVWPTFRRRGLGTALLASVCTAARHAGAEHAVLNATPEGKLLYSTCGFTQIGQGATWWLHLS